MTTWYFCRSWAGDERWFKFIPDPERWVIVRTIEVKDS
jgi:hypothetical protein